MTQLMAYGRSLTDWISGKMNIIGHLKQTSCLDYYRNAHASYVTVIEQCNDPAALTDLEVAHNAKDDLNLWLNTVAQRREADVFKLAVHEYRFAILCLVQGFYRQAFSSLRLFLELSLAMVQMSTNELQLRRWLAGEGDIRWQSIIEDKNGIFAPEFVKVFCGELVSEAKHMQKNAGAVYSECSEFVHGKIATYGPLSENVTFSKDAFDLWIARAASARYIVHYCLAMRYTAELEKAQLQKLEKLLVKELGHVSDFGLLVASKVK